jgi:hypothetical protein
MDSKHVGLISACTLRFALVVCLFEDGSAQGEEVWRPHVIYEGGRCDTSVAADFTGDGLPDIVCNSNKKTRLLVAPDWQEVVVEGEQDLRFIHGETMDVDGDGDPDFIGAQYTPGYIAWLERPDRPLKERWRLHLIDDQVHGVHGLLVGDVDGNGALDLLANSGQPTGPFSDSLVWYSRPHYVRRATGWNRHIFAQGDAPGLSHYLGLGDVNGDGRPDAASGAKGGPADESGKGNWFAWWEAPEDPTTVWTKHFISAYQAGATNIHPADINADGHTDFVASRGHGKGVVWFEGPSWTEHLIHPLEGPHCLVVADIDGDNDLDAATCAKDDKLVAWFENDGNGHFQSHVIGQNQAAYDIRATDIDVDGDLDLLVAGQFSENVVWYQNPR